MDGFGHTKPKYIGIYERIGREKDVGIIEFFG